MHKDLYEKFFHFCHDVIENYEEIGLSREEMKKVVELKIMTKKQMIQDSAAVELITVDIFAQLWSEKTEASEVNKLLDRKYEAKKDAMKRFVESFVTLKKMLKPDQIKKVMQICRQHKKPMEKGEECCK